MEVPRIKPSRRPNKSDGAVVRGNIKCHGLTQDELGVGNVPGVSFPELKQAPNSGRRSTSETAHLAHSSFSPGWSEFHAVLLLRGFLSDQLGDVALFVNSLSVLIDLALFKLYGFFTDDALRTPLVFGYIFGWLN